MKSIARLLPFLWLAGCGGLKDTNPLLGLAGAQDGSRFGFESSLQGWFKSASGSVDQVFHADKASFFGSGCLGLHVSAMGKDASSTAWIGVTFTVQPSLAGRVWRCFVYAPAASSPGDDKPTYAQAYFKDGNGDYANGPGINLARDAWTQVSWAPYANPGASAITAGNVFINPGFDPAAVSEMGLKLAASGSAGDFTYTGIFFIDSVDW